MSNTSGISKARPRKISNRWNESACVDKGQRLSYCPTHSKKTINRFRSSMTEQRIGVLIGVEVRYQFHQFRQCRQRQKRQRQSRGEKWLYQTNLVNTGFRIRVILSRNIALFLSRARVGIASTPRTPIQKTPIITRAVCNAALNRLLCST